MDYKKVYDNLIAKGLNRTNLEGYSEMHHIKPRSLGGSDEKHNLVKLTAKEHLLAHLLLVEIYPKSKALKYAAWAMVNQNSLRKNKISFRTYQRLREEKSKMVKKATVCKCSYCGKEVSKVPSQLSPHFFCSRECYIKNGGVVKGEVHIYKGEERKFVSKKDLPEYLTQGWQKGRPFLQKKVVQKDLLGNVIKVYSSVKEATLTGEFGVTGISQCANGKRRHHKGYVWSYEE